MVNESRRVVTMYGIPECEEEHALGLYYGPVTLLYLDKPSAV